MTVYTEFLTVPDALPVRPPRLRDHRVALAPFLFELGERGKGSLLGLSRIDQPQVADQRLAIDPGHEPRRAPDQVHDASLDDRLREHGLDRVREALEAIAADDEHVAHAAVLEFGDDLQPEPRAFVRLDPQPEHFLLALDVDAEREIDVLVLHHALVADLHHHRVEVNDRAPRLERARLPLGEPNDNGGPQARDQAR